MGRPHLKFWGDRLPCQTTPSEQLYRLLRLFSGNWTSILRAGIWSTPLTHDSARDYVCASQNVLE